MGAILHKLRAAVAKEMRIILRDREALLVLFVMPVMFVLIMSLALQDAFSERAGIRFPLLIIDHDQGVIGDRLIQHFSDDSAFAVTTLRDVADDEAHTREELRKGRYKFAIIVPLGASRDAARRMDRQLGLVPGGQTPEAVGIRLLADPTLRRDHRGLVISGLNRVLQGIESGMLLARYVQLAERVRARGGAPGRPGSALSIFADIIDDADNASADQTGAPAHTQVPTSVQQNAPAWTLLAMFFLVIPLSVTLIKERQQGSLMRLQSMAVPPWVLLAGKTLPYFIINQIQLLLILLVGIHLLPRLGGDALHIGDAPGAIALLSLAASLAAIGYGLLVATFARTPEQATTFGATSVLIFAALGGVMVPKLVMPPVLQQISSISPLSWGLEGFLDIFVRGGGVKEVLPEFLQLLAFAAACMSIAVLRFSHGLRHN